ncbi:sugar phosphate isomerase/epimerase family protein [Microbacterium sp. Mcb102]|uniref:sugar phosphate isomerase/epimerase family protein n=1 Tax=Microbacterium sp. Mcb102 TaxID=2926012 RepID=UPI0021C5E530|nr:sugar phosphate isomerase/epimerase [Microbacterium sp. Mcb102]
MSLPGAAVMLYTVDALLDDDFEGVLERIAALGYTGVETYGLHGRSATDVNKMLKRTGLTVVSAHAPFPFGPDAARILDEYAELGTPNLAWSMEAEEFDDLDAIERGLERVNGGVEAAKAHGMTVAYHNHHAEFRNVIDGRSAYDLLLERLHPDARVELDLYWAAVGGASPAEVVRSIGPRLRYVHVKDGPALTYGQDTLVPIGRGAVDVLGALQEPSTLEWHIVELEKLDIDPFDALDESYRYLTGHGVTAGAR